MKYFGKDHAGYKLCINNKIMEQDIPLNELHYVSHKTGKVFSQLSNFVQTTATTLHTFVSTKVLT